MVPGQSSEGEFDGQDICHTLWEGGACSLTPYYGDG